MAFSPPIPNIDISVQDLLCNNNCVHQGHLSKHTTVLKYITKWIPYYVVLHSGCLYIYRQYDHSKPKIAISLYGYHKVSEVTNAEEMHKREHTFKLEAIQPNMVTFLLSTPAEKDMKIWLQKFQQGLEEANLSTYGVSRSLSVGPSDPSHRPRERAVTKEQRKHVEKIYSKGKVDLTVDKHDYSEIDEWKMVKLPEEDSKSCRATVAGSNYGASRQSGVDASFYEIRQDDSSFVPLPLTPGNKSKKTKVPTNPAQISGSLCNLPTTSRSLSNPMNISTGSSEPTSPTGATLSASGTSYGAAWQTRGGHGSNSTSRGGIGKNKPLPPTPTTAQATTANKKSSAERTLHDYVNMGPGVDLGADEPSGPTAQRKPTPGPKPAHISVFFDERKSPDGGELLEYMDMTKDLKWEDVFWSDTERKGPSESTRLLAELGKDGVYLVRQSTSSTGGYTVCVRLETVMGWLTVKFVISKSSAGYSIADDGSFPTIVALLQHYSVHDLPNRPGKLLRVPYTQAI